MIKRDFVVSTSEGIELSGVLTGSEGSKGIIVLCHGLLNNKESKVIRKLEEYFQSHLSQYSFCRFDFRGNGYSSGETSYGNYQEEAKDIFYITQHLAHNFLKSHGPVVAVCGHSKASSDVLIYADTFADRISSKLLIVGISGRFDMTGTPATRFTKEQMACLERDGKFEWKPMKVRGNEEKMYVVTREGLEQRAALNMSAISKSLKAKIDSGSVPVSVELFHGTADEVIPVDDLKGYENIFGTDHVHRIEGCSHFYERQKDIDYLGEKITQLLHKKE
ncbi:hypothetical protein MP638_000795 [Amoeboaphelidium occidentale]|nr:hypothetical protein MP638_000795 [Amoeboaphelidium occidentale]